MNFIQVFFLTIFLHLLWNKQTKRLLIYFTCPPLFPWLSKLSHLWIDLYTMPRYEWQSIMLARENMAGLHDVIHDILLIQLSQCLPRIVIECHFKNSSDLLWLMIWHIFRSLCHLAEFSLRLFTILWNSIQLSFHAIHVLPNFLQFGVHLSTVAQKSVQPSTHFEERLGTPINSFDLSRRR